MAIKFVCAVKDSASDLFGQPFVVPATAAAVRSVSDEANRSAADNPLFNHPDDFVLFSLGTLDDVSGLLVPDLQQVARVKDLISPR